VAWKNFGTKELNMNMNLNIKTLAKGMRVEDKAKLLFADRNKRGETSGKEGLLTPDEEKAIIDDAQDLHQITELNRLNKLFNMSSFLMLDIQTAYLHFKLAEGRLLNMLTGMILVGEGSDALGNAIYDLSSNGYSQEQLEDEKFQVEVDKKAEEFRKKYKRNGLTEIYDYFDPSVGDGSYFDTKTEVLSQPNPLLQRAFMMVIQEIKKFRKQIYNIEYIETKARIDLLSERDKRTLESFTNEIDDFVNLKDHLGLIKMFADFADKGMLKRDGLSEPKFLEAIKNMSKATRLSKKAKIKAESEIEEVIQKQSY